MVYDIDKTVKFMDVLDETNENQPENFLSKEEFYAGLHLIESKGKLADSQYVFDNPEVLDEYYDAVKTRKETFESFIERACKLRSPTVIANDHPLNKDKVISSIQRFFNLLWLSRTEEEEKEEAALLSEAYDEAGVTYTYLNLLSSFATMAEFSLYKRSLEHADTKDKTDAAFKAYSNLLGLVLAMSGDRIEAKYGISLLDGFDAVTASLLGARSLEVAEKYLQEIEQQTAEEEEKSVDTNDSD